MTETYLYVIAGILFGVVVGSVIHLVHFIKMKKIQKSLEGYLETEKLIRERFQKENALLHESKEGTQAEADLKIQQLNQMIRIMDEDILLLQKSNEETEAMLKAGDPMIHTLKLKLIEANNTIARYKAQVLVS